MKIRVKSVTNVVKSPCENILYTHVLVKQTKTKSMHECIRLPQYGLWGGFDEQTLSFLCRVGRQQIE